MRKAVAAAVGAMLAAGSAPAVTVQWADLTGATTDQVTGTIAVGSETIGVTYSGPYAFADTDGSTYWWSEGDPKPYTGGSVENAPATPDIIALNMGGRKTITFSRAVSDVYLVLVSWNGNSGTFDQPFEVVSQGCGFWGCGSFQDVTPTSFSGQNELHGVIRFTGNFTSVSFTDNNEHWHGFQVGIAGLAPNAIPEPGQWALMLGGFGLLGVAARRSRAGGAVANA